jgi:magnesium chelatase family protein
MAISAKNAGMTEIYLPAQNAREASAVEGISVYGVTNVSDLIAHLQKRITLEPEPRYYPDETKYEELYDFSDVKGQEAARSAIETAAAGFHNLIMIGAPGSGKSMLAKRVPSILPAMSFGETLETTQIHSVAGLLDPDKPLLTQRPFRTAGHTASAAGLIGGGSSPKPGEISLAHNGVLFLDEFAEFDRRTLETLRQPMEDGEIFITRVSGKVNYPCKFMLIAAMNPCPCGNYGSTVRKCSCPPNAVMKYLNKISGPVLDRIDIQVEVPPVTYDEISDTRKNESSAAIRERVAKAREIQIARYKGTNILFNSQIPASLLNEICVTDDSAKALFQAAFEKLGMSARAYDRLLKVARTAADLDGEPVINRFHAAKALQYRSLDKKFWKNR